MLTLKQNINRIASSKPLATAVVCTAVMLAVWALNQSNPIEVPTKLFLPIHTLIEIFSAVVCISIFLISWHTAGESTSNYSLVLGNAFLFVGLVDLMHALTYRGMPPFVFPTSPARPTLYWVIARLANALALLWATVSRPAASPSKLRRTLGAVAAVAAAAAVLAVVTWKPHWLPAMYDEQHQRLTTAKVALEYFVIALHLAAIGILLGSQYNHRER
ncbi:MAG: MASE3 domain-containing protein, partial [Armatimonadota bacterium]